MNSLTFAQLREAHIKRMPLYRNSKGQLSHPAPDGSDWTPAQWFQALVGELGEYANFRKKFERGDFSEAEFKNEAAKELADIQCYLDILAWQLGIDLGQAVEDKFNEVSRRIGVDVFLNKDKTMRQFSGNENEVYDLLDDVVIEFTNAAKSFTAYDITTEARKRTDVEFFHRDVAQHIHSAVRHIAPGYAVRQHAAYQAREYYNSGLAKPLLAHGAPARNLSGVGKIIKSANLGPYMAGVSNVARIANAVGTASPKSEGRVLVPAILIKYIGAKPGDLLNVEVKSNQLLLSKNIVSASSKKAYVVDKHSNIRLSQRTLSKAGLANRKVRLVAEKDVITID